MKSIKYGIVAYRSNGERVYFLSNDTQGERMVPYASTLAALYPSKGEAKKTIDRISLKFNGLTGWTVFQEI